jgi:hypothetical protein
MSILSLSGRRVISPVETTKTTNTSILQRTATV